MIYLLYGEDGLSLDEALALLTADAGPEELQDVNVTALDGATVGFDEFAATCSTVPFLADKRVVILRGLLSRFETRGFGGEYRLKDDDAQDDDSKDGDPKPALKMVVLPHCGRPMMPISMY